MAQSVLLSSSKFRALAAVLLISGAMVGGHLLPGLDNSRVEDGIRNGLHILVFAVFAVIIFQYMKSSSTVMAVSTAIIVAAMIGGLAETFQYLSGRQPDLFDVVRDLAGAVLGIAACLLWQWSANKRISRSMSGTARSISVLLGIAIIAPALFWSSIIGMGRMTSPVILDFDQWWNQYIFRPINAEISTPTAVAGAAELYLQKRGRSGLIVSPMMTDWTDYEYLTITAEMASGPDTNVTLRINDGDRKNNWSDQFLASIVIVPDSSTIRIPLRELINEPGQPTMDLSDIQEVVIFARDRRRDTVMRIENIRLE